MSKETKLVPKLSLKYPHASGFTLEKLEVASNGAVTTETSLVDTFPGLKIEFKGNDSNKGDLGLTYNHKLATVTADVDALNFAKASASVSGGFDQYTYGASADFNLAKSALGPLTATVGYSIPKVLQLFVKSTKTFTDYSVLASYVVNKDVTVAAQALLVASTWQLTFAGLYKCNPQTAIKVKASTNAGLNFSLKQTFDKKFVVTGAAEIPKSYDNIKFGVAASLG